MLLKKTVIKFKRFKCIKYYFKKDKQRVFKNGGLRFIYSQHRTWSQERNRNIKTCVFIFHHSIQHDEASGYAFHNKIDCPSLNITIKFVSSQSLKQLKGCHVKLVGLLVSFIDNIFQ